MTTTRTHHTEQFVSFWKRNFPDVNCPPFPKSKDQLSLGVQLLMRDEAPQLWQNLFAQSSQNLPADTELRRQRGELLPSDEQALLDADLDAEAAECRKLGEQIQQLKSAKEAELGRKRYLEEKKRQEAWSNADYSSRLAMSPLTPQAIQQAKREWGISE